MSAASDMVRKTFREGDDKRDEGLTTPDNIERYDDIQYGKDAEWNMLDVYRPKWSKGDKLPVIVSVHGGGWVYGDKERYQYYCMSLALHGFAVVNFTYRLAPEHKYPAAIEDINAVFAWVLEHADEYDFDTEHIFGVGDSAGAHQLGLYAAICTNREYAAEYDCKVPEDFKPTAVALNCGVYKIDTDIDDLTVELMGDYLPGKGTKQELEMISVVNHMTEEYVPVFYMTCTGDFLLGQAPVLEAKLLEKKIPHEFHFYGDKDHELGHVFHCNMKSEYAAKCNKDECDFFKKHI